MEWVINQQGCIYSMQLCGEVSVSSTSTPPHHHTIQQLKHDPHIRVHSIVSEVRTPSPQKPPPPPPPSPPKPAKQYQAAARQLMDEPDGFGEVMRLAYVYGGEVQIDEECLYYLQKYSSCPIALVGLLGDRGSGKSLLMDTILNLSSSQGNQFTTVYGQEQPIGIYLWSQPYSYHNTPMKVFWVECSGVELGCGQLNRIEEILIDLVMVMCSSVVMLTPPAPQNKKAHIFEKNEGPSPLETNGMLELTRSAERILSEGKGATKHDQHWPKNMFYMHRSRQPPANNSVLSQLFLNCYPIHLPAAQVSPDTTREQLLLSFNESMAHFHPSYPAAVYSLLALAVPRSTPKQYGQLKYTGNILCKMLINTIKYLNRKPTLKIDKVFAALTKQIYLHSLQYHQDLYNEQLEAHFSHETPMSTDQLFSTFSLMTQEVLNSFNEFVVEEKMHMQYQEQLMSYIGKKQVAVIDINAKKTKKALVRQSKNIEYPQSYDKRSINQFFLSIQTIEPSLDHNRTNTIAHTLLEYSQTVEARIIEETRRKEQEKIKYLKKEVEKSKGVLQKEKQKNSDAIALNKANEAQDKAYKKEKIKKEALMKQHYRSIEDQKRYQKDIMISKESKKKYAEQLLEKLREEEQKFRDNERIKKDIEKEYEYHPQILQLQKKLDERARNIKQVEKMQQKELSALASRSQIGKSSVVRSSVQKSSSPAKSSPAKPAQAQSKKPIKRLSAKR